MTESCGHPWFWSIVGFFSGAFVSGGFVYLETILARRAVGRRPT